MEKINGRKFKEKPTAAIPTLASPCRKEKVAVLVAKKKKSLKSNFSKSQDNFAELSLSGLQYSLYIINTRRTPSDAE